MFLKSAFLEIQKSNFKFIVKKVKHIITTSKRRKYGNRITYPFNVLISVSKLVVEQLENFHGFVALAPSCGVLDAVIMKPSAALQALPTPSCPEPRLNNDNKSAIV